MVIYMKPQELTIKADTEQQLIKCISKSNDFQFSQMIVDSEAKTLKVTAIAHILYRFLYELSCDFYIELL